MLEGVPPPDRAALAQRAVQALRSGDARGARDAFERIVAGGRADAQVYVGLAYACRSLNDRAACAAAIEKALTIEPQNLRALILRADLLAEEGDARAASAFYLAAVKAAPPADRLPPDLRSEVARAGTECERYAAHFESVLRNSLAAGGLEEGLSARRFRHSLDIVFGKKKIYSQQPRYYFFPELPHVQFYERSDFPWLDRIEAATADIRSELIEVLREEAAFKPYVEGDPNRPRSDEAGMLNNPAWSAYYLWKDGNVVADHAARCPRTMAALEEAPLTSVKGRSPAVLFSLLRPHTRIPPHNGFVNTRLICHLPLIVPESCGLRVGNETRVPVEGKAWLFDDTIEHEAWNDSDRTRVILLFEIWRPELSDEERRLVSAMFEAIDAHSGQRSAWGI
jgi:aspartyl/asparaginyl beta-hydroxylase (cupin superfamily)